MLITDRLSGMYLFSSFFSVVFQVLFKRFLDYLSHIFRVAEIIAAYFWLGILDYAFKLLIARFVSEERAQEDIVPILWIKPHFHVYAAS